MFTHTRSLLGCSSLALIAALGLVSCAVPLGPGYTVRKQTVDIRFQPSSEAPVSVEAHYLVANTGNQPLASLDVRLPRSSVLRLASPSLRWDGQPIPFDRHEDPAGDVLRLNFAQPWPVKQSHNLTVKYDVAQGAPNTSQLDLAADSFYLPPGDAVPSLLPPKGTFSSGGAPPKKWILTVRVPQDFLVHTPGHPKRQKRENAELRADFEQRPYDLVPFVVAGRYHVWQYRESHQTVIFWKKAPPQPADLEPLTRDVAGILQTYDSLFGPRAKRPQPIRIIDSPMPVKQHDEVRKNPDGSLATTDVVTLFSSPPEFGFLPVTKSGEPAFSQRGLIQLLEPQLAWTWLGYGRNPQFDTIGYPLKALPDYAAEIVEETLRGPQTRSDTIRNLLQRVLQSAAKPNNSSALDHEKSVLFFFALEDQFGRDHLHAALRHMVQARRTRGYDLDDLIASLEAETHKPVAPFVRLWLKHPDIPEEFRARYAAPAMPPDTAPKENPQ